MSYFSRIFDPQRDRETLNLVSLPMDKNEKELILQCLIEPIELDFSKTLFFDRQASRIYEYLDVENKLAEISAKKALNQFSGDLTKEGRRFLERRFEEESLYCNWSRRKKVIAFFMLVIPTSISLIGLLSALDVGTYSGAYKLAKKTSQHLEIHNCYSFSNTKRCGALDELTGEPVLLQKDGRENWELQKL